MIVIVNKLVSFLKNVGNTFEPSDSKPLSDLFGLADIIIDRFVNAGPYTSVEVNTLKSALIDCYIALYRRGVISYDNMRYLDADTTGKFKALDYTDDRNDETLKALHWLYDNQGQLDNLVYFNKFKLDALGMLNALTFIKRVYDVTQTDNFKFNLMAEIKRDSSGKSIGYGNTYKGASNDMHTLLKMAKVLGYFKDGEENIFYKRCMIIDGVSQCDDVIGDINLTEDELRKLVAYTDEFGGD